MVRSSFTFRGLVPTNENQLWQSGDGDGDGDGGAAAHRTQVLYSIFLHEGPQNTPVLLAVIPSPNRDHKLLFITTRPEPRREIVGCRG